MGGLGLCLGFGLLAPAAFLASRHGFRQPAGVSRWLGGTVLAWAWVTIGVELLGSLGLLLRWPLLAWSALGLILAGIVAVVRPSSVDPSVDRAGPRPGFSATIAMGLLIWASSRFFLVSLLSPVKVVSDGPIYHLYFAARWWKAGRLILVASPFGEVGAPYFWANGEVWFAWLMTLWGGDAFAKLGQVPFFGIALATVYAMARRAGASCSSALVATVCFGSVPPLILFGFEPNVDVLFVSGYLLACYFFTRYALGDDGWPSLALGALAAGLGMGTKPTGIVFFPPLLALASVPIFRRAISGRARLVHLALLASLPVLTAGFWPLRNAWLTGNPLYPLRVEAFGRTWLAGWFGPGAMSRSPYYIRVSDWWALGDILLVLLDPRMLPLWIAGLLGGWAIGRRVGETPRWVWGFAALAVANLALYWLVVPYRTQQRFMLQALGLAAVPLALTIDRASWIRAAATGLLAIHFLTPQVWPIALEEKEISWDLDPRIPNITPALIVLPLEMATTRAVLAIPLARASLESTLVLGLWAFPAAWLWLRVRGAGDFRGLMFAASATLVLAGVGVFWMGGYSKQTVPSFPDYYAAWTELELRAGPGGVRIAYAGTDIPYYLMGAGLRNEVRYINVDGHRDWMMHDYQAHARSAGQPETWPDPFPGWDRLRPDYDAWLENLRSERIGILVVAKANPNHGLHNVADRERFPIERRWADTHPETFEIFHGVAPPDPNIRLYRLLPEKIRASSTDPAARLH